MSLFRVRRVGPCPAFALTRRLYLYGRMTSSDTSQLIVYVQVTEGAGSRVSEIGSGLMPVMWP